MDNEERSIGKSFQKIGQKIKGTMLRLCDCKKTHTTLERHTH